MHWTVGEQRTDELGTLGKSLNRLSRNLSAALSDLQNANRKLEADIEHEKEMEQARTNFFSAVSHELKTPITILKGQLEGMLLGIGAYKDREKYLTRTLEIANILETMVQEILTISRLETAGADIFISALTEHGHVVFSVENTGVHILTDSKHKLFGAFYRVEQSRSRKTGGSGLGLYIVQEILRQHESVCTVCNTQLGVKFSCII